MAVQKVLSAMQAAWEAKKPWSPHPRSRNEGRYAITHMHAMGIPADKAQTLLEDWLHSGQIALEMVDRNTKAKGLKVVDNTVQVVRDWRENRAGDES